MFHAIIIEGVCVGSTVISGVFVITGSSDGFAVGITGAFVGAAVGSVSPSLLCEGVLDGLLSGVYEAPGSGQLFIYPLSGLSIAYFLSGS